jgi:thiamine biosynthesis lipoprotein
MRTVLLVALLTLTACSGEHGSVELVGSTMGTQFSVKLPNGIGDYVPLRLQKDIEAALEDAEAEMSTYQWESVITQFNVSDSVDWYTVEGTFCDKVQQSLQISELTGGAFDITVGPLVNLWGFGPADIIDTVPDDATVATLLEITGFEHLRADCSRPAIKKDIAELMLDMSGIGKGFAADRVADLLEDLGFESYLVEIGGELRIRGQNAAGNDWAIGIEAPLPNARKAHTVVHLSDTAMATSGDYRNFFETDGKMYSHTIDTRTGRPVTHSLASVTVIDEEAWRADALATALLVMGPEDGMAFAEREGMAVLMLLRTDDGIEERQTIAFKKLRNG